MAIDAPLEVPTITSTLTREPRLLIDGELVEQLSGETLTVLDPRDRRADRHRGRRGGRGLPVLAAGGGAQALAVNYTPMCEQIAENVEGQLISDCGHWIAEEKPIEFVDLFTEFDSAARTQ